MTTVEVWRARDGARRIAHAPGPTWLRRHYWMRALAACPGPQAPRPAPAPPRGGGDQTAARALLYPLVSRHKRRARTGIRRSALRAMAVSVLW